MCNKNEALEILHQVYDRCKKVFGKIEKCYLYGSYARGDYHSESDVDILLTVKMSTEEIESYGMDVAKISSDLSLEHDVMVSIAVKPAEQFERYREILPYYQNVVNEGIRYAG